MKEKEPVNNNQPVGFPDIVVEAEKIVERHIKIKMEREITNLNRMIEYGNGSISSYRKKVHEVNDWMAMLFGEESNKYRTNKVHLVMTETKGLQVFQGDEIDCDNLESGKKPKKE
jgi:hypothetical protein